MVGPLFFCYTPMHEVTPKVVATAVRTVMRMFRIFWISSFLFMVVEWFSGWLVFVIGLPLGRGLGGC